MSLKEVDRIVTEIMHSFRTFGGGRDSNSNPMAAALKDSPLMFAAGVDVRDVVCFVLASVPKKRRAPARKVGAVARAATNGHRRSTRA